tara:strand:- start:55 stop:510 length:456 start_codon:yes stop_codon:yes gene_type:complete
MATQAPVSDLWTPVSRYKNIAIRTSCQMAPIDRASIKTWYAKRNPNPKDKGNDVNGYIAQPQEIRILPAVAPPKFREDNQLDPMQQRDINLAMEKFAVPDPRMNITGMHVPTTERLANMDIQTANFNYNGIFAILGILGSIVAIVWLARRK